MISHRYYGTIVHVTAAGGIVVERADGGGRVFAGPAEAARAGTRLISGDRVEFSVSPGAAVLDVLLLGRPGRILPAG